ncbi:hypothetical protein EIP91_000661 [Steccherinum ochraceum]|uniref:Transcription initiation factor IIF subunit alpha n=1 Tax=Steccherinum ochraceum TaxID=92696 RepID=A0A4R0RFJ3_9APHY|nr:hypothetical protein EIP91_000661 [Steccherinum ochraceum]
MPPSASSLFHPKKRPLASSQAKPKTPVGTPPSSSTPPATSQSLESLPPTQPPSSNGSTTPKLNGSNPPTPNKRPRLGTRKPVGKPSASSTAEDDAKPSEPEGPFSEFRLVSSALNGWKYDVMKFDSRKVVDIMTWPAPVKLNRKDPFRKDGNDVVQQAPQAVGPMLGPDGKPVIGMDGRMVMVDANGRPIRAGDANGTASPAGSANGGANGKDKERPSKKKFQKKTKQVFLVPDEVRQLRREERYPWVLEDGQHGETWVGKMEEVAKSDTHAMFMPAANDVFKFVPAHRWYKFQKKPAHQVLSLEEAETLMSQRNKNKDAERWLLRNRAQAASDSGNVKTEGGMMSAHQGASLVHSTSQSLGPGGRRLRTTDHGGGRDLFGDDDEEGGGRGRSRELGAEGDLDELDFEEDFADDEEKIEPDGEDEEAKEIEERLKKEYKAANKTREGYIDESEEEEDDKPKLSSSHKSMQKLIKKLDNQLQGDDDDDDADPYASGEEESSDEEEPQVQTGPAIQPHEPKANSRAGSQGPSGSKTPTPSQAPPVKTESTSRATSPVPPSHGGHSVMAKRATSPKVPKLKTNGASRAGSPLAGAGSRATSPVTPSAPGAGRADSPPAPGGGDAAKAGNKRKAMDEPTSPTGGSASAGAPSKPKKRKAAPAGEITQQMLVDWLNNTPNATTKDCIQYFSPYLPKEDKHKKQAFADLVKEVAILKDGVLVLRVAYRASGGAASPPPG